MRLKCECKEVPNKRLESREEVGRRNMHSSLWFLNSKQMIIEHQRRKERRKRKTEYDELTWSSSQSKIVDCQRQEDNDGEEVHGKSRWCHDDDTSGVCLASFLLCFKIRQKQE